MKWDEALHKTLSAHWNQPFSWGSWDCCQFVREYAINLAGIDFGADVLLQYADEEGAERILDARDGVEGLLTSLLGEPHQIPEPGDIVTLMVNEETAGVYCGSWSIVIGQNGAARTMATPMRAWSCLKA